MIVASQPTIRAGGHSNFITGAGGFLQVSPHFDRRTVDLFAPACMSELHLAAERAARLGRPSGGVRRRDELLAPNAAADGGLGQTALA